MVVFFPGGVVGPIAFNHATPNSATRLYIYNAAPISEAEWDFLVGSISKTGSLTDGPLTDYFQAQTSVNPDSSTATHAIDTDVTSPIKGMRRIEITVG